jgi:hypothetical protein
VKAPVFNAAGLTLCARTWSAREILKLQFGLGHHFMCGLLSM